jgi:hypothetical protein
MYFLQFLAVGVGNHASTTRDREDNMQIDLRVRIGHLEKVNMTLLTELITFTCVAAINMPHLRR